MGIMTSFKMKRVYEEPAVSDGYRVLVDRLWPRGLKKENLKCDEWAKDLAPSADLRKWFHEDRDARWQAFVLSYQKELDENGHIGEILARMKDKQVVTLLYAAKEKVHNHVLILKDWLDKESNNH